jgi:hypothetical protein
MDWSELTLSEKLVGGGAIVLLIGTFLPWYGVSSSSIAGSYSAHANLWSNSSFLAFLILLGCVVSVGIIVMRMMDIFDVSMQGIPESLVVLIAAGLAGVITVIKVLFVPGGSASGSFGELGSFSYGRQWGLWIALIGAVVLVVGAAMKFNEERA